CCPHGPGRTRETRSSSRCRPVVPVCRHRGRERKGGRHAEYSSWVNGIQGRVNGRPTGGVVVVVCRGGGRLLGHGGDDDAALAGGEHGAGAGAEEGGFSAGQGEVASAGCVEFHGAFDDEGDGGAFGKPHRFLPGFGDDEREVVDVGPVFDQAVPH